MKLTYRGIQYQPETNSLEIKEGEIGGKYRGQPWRYHYPRHVLALKPKLWLEYRGVHYSKCAVVNSCDLREIAIPAINPDQEISTPRHFAGQMQEATADQAHLENIRRNLERRISIAREKGNEQLVSMLEREYQDLAINN